MTRRILAIIIGIIVAMGVIALNEYIVGKIFPFPSGNDYKNSETMRTFMENASVLNYLLILSGYMLGCFCGGAVATLIEGKNIARAAFIVGSVILVSGVMNLVMLPGQPMWFIVTCLIIYIPCSLIGYLVVRKVK